MSRFLLVSLAAVLVLSPAAPAAAQPADSTAITDSLQAALDRFERAQPPTAADSAVLRQWTDSVQTKGVSIREPKPKQARGLLQQALEGRRALADSVAMTRLIGHIGLTRLHQTQYEQALGNSRKALALARETDASVLIAKVVKNLVIGAIHGSQDRYDKALDHLQKALAAAREVENPEAIAATLVGIGSIYLKQARYEKALPVLRKSLEIRRELGNLSQIARTLIPLGNAYNVQGRYEEALASYEESLRIQREIGDQRLTAMSLNNIGNIYMKQGRPEKAVEYFREALEIYPETGDRKGAAGTLDNIGSILRRRGRSEEALTHFRNALAINQEVGARSNMALNLRNIGETHLREGHLLGATDTLSRAADLAEQLRRNASSPEARRSLLSTQIDVYHALTTAHVRSGRPDSALRSVEQARARLLADRLAGTARGDTTFSIPSADELRRTLDSGEAALLYANVDPDQPLTAIVVTSEDTYARELPDSTIRAEIEQAYPTRLNRLRRAEGPLTEALGAEAAASGTDEGTLLSLAEAVRLYRDHLVRSEADVSVQQDLSRRLRELLIKPVADHVSAAEKLTVVPTGALGYLPFETLRDSTGTYLVEETGIRYAQSLTVRRQLQQRDYGGRENSLLAVGGAAYQPEVEIDGESLVAEARGGSTRVATDEHASTLLRSAETRMEQGKSPRPTYQQLGYRTWSDLPGTQEEVMELGTLSGPSSTVISGPEASEDTIRAMSERGQLFQYRRVHFATHGVAVPETPALSALVLSQVGASDSLAARDGYLTMEEIADLKMQADVAVLSACQTGLGKVVAGEGVVSLSHAFLRAGANATLVSQWKVLDESTRQFMTAVYEKAQGEETSFAEAVTETKRAFIEDEYGEKNTDPLRWAPFVYYGREDSGVRSR